MPSKFKLNSSPPSRGRREIQGSPSFLKKNSKEENIGTMTDHRPYFFKIICDSHETTIIGNDVVGNYVFLADGWPEFVKDNSLKIKDSLLFQHDGNMLFSVMIFDANGVERIGVN
ncbi:hypothetical protein Patl1_10494 [Pistacia atlantica]|uniref:Uncharacterized protein n=1 Tax=Pistacia atlantica TaxID=434234 RepID=A0ACC1A4D0_9ROSI|nr:hypothetical protein Patl1_10494 [Pistacia atlantica]